MASTSPPSEGTATVTDVGGTQSVTIPANPEGQAQIEGDKLNGIQPAPARPEGLPEGFDSWEDYGQAVSSGKINPDGTPREEAPKEPAAEAPQPEALTEEQQGEVDAALESMPEDGREKARPFFEEFARTGDIAEDSRKAAAEAFGVSVEMVDAYVAGAKSQQATALDEALTEAGTTGAEYEAFREWAATGYTPEQMAQFNSALVGDSTKAIKDAIAAWKEGGNAPAPRDITRGERPTAGGNAQAAQPYESIAQMQQDMSNPLYASDPAFRAKVEGRVAASPFNLGRAL